MADTVSIVLDPAFGEMLLELASKSHVWVIDTPTNRLVTEEYWARPCDRKEWSITTFRINEDNDECEVCLGILDTVDLHHGEYSSVSPYETIAIFGCDSKPGLRSALQALGFTRFEETVGGFRATKAR